MKGLFMTGVILCCLSAQSQTTEEWLNQKQTKIKRLMEQIAANAVYIEYARQGYQIITTGLHLIRDINRGDLLQHTSFFQSLANLNPIIRRTKLAGSVTTVALRLQKWGDAVGTILAASGELSSQEKYWVQDRVRTVLREAAGEIADGAHIFLKDQSLLTDDQRLKRIEELLGGLRDKLSFMQSLATTLKQLQLARVSERMELLYSKKLAR